MSNDEFKAFNEVFTKLLEGFGEEVVCEVEGHDNPESPVYQYHDDDGVGWKEIFCCPKCGFIVVLIVCDTMHISILDWKENYPSGENFQKCGKCGAGYSLQEAHEGSQQWG